MVNMKSVDLSAFVGVYHPGVEPADGTKSALGLRQRVVVYERNAVRAAQPAIAATVPLGLCRAGAPTPSAVGAVAGLALGA